MNDLSLKLKKVNEILASCSLMSVDQKETADNSGKTSYVFTIKANSISEQLNEKKLWIRITKDSNLEIKTITEILEQFKGNSKVIFYREIDNLKVWSECYVDISDWELLDKLRSLVGDKNILVKE